MNLVEQPNYLDFFNEIFKASSYWGNTCQTFSCGSMPDRLTHRHGLICNLLFNSCMMKKK